MVMSAERQNCNYRSMMRDEPHDRDACVTSAFSGPAFRLIGLLVLHYSSKSTSKDSSRISTGTTVL